MLVLSRKRDEGVHFVMKTKDGGEKEVKLRVLSIGQNKVKFGIETDPDVGIYRHELKEATVPAATPPMALST